MNQRTTAIIVPRMNPRLNQPISVQKPRPDLACFVINYHTETSQEAINREIQIIARRHDDYLIYNEPGFLNLLDTIQSRVS